MPFLPIFASLRCVEFARRFPCKVSLWKLFLARFVVRTSCVPRSTYAMSSGVSCPLRLLCFPLISCLYHSCSLLFVVFSLLIPGPADCAPAIKSAATRRVGACLNGPRILRTLSSGQARAVCQARQIQMILAPKIIKKRWKYV